MTVDKKTLDRINAQQKWALSGKPLTLKQRVEILEATVERMKRDRR